MTQLYILVQAFNHTSCVTKFSEGHCLPSYCQRISKMLRIRISIHVLTSPAQVSPIEVAQQKFFRCVKKQVIQNSMSWYKITLRMMVRVKSLLRPR